MMSHTSIAFCMISQITYLYLHDFSRRIFAHLQFLQQEMRVGTYKQ